MEGGSPGRFTQFSASCARELMHDSRASAEGALAQRRLNRLQWPLLRLPPEILSMILYAVVFDTRSDLTKWMHYGHICHDLRAALLGMQTLWAGVVFDARYEHLREELLERAGECLLTIELGSKPSPHAVDRALELSVRARKLNAYGLLTDQMEAIVVALEQGLPSLVDLRLGWRHDAPPPPNALTAFSSLPELIVSKLHTLALLDIFIPFDISSLKVLSLTWNDTMPTPMQDARALADMLCRCEKLESLTLRGWIPERDTVLSIRQTISLPRLVHLALHQELDHVLALWALLKIPASASVSVSMPQEGWLGLLEGVLSLTDPLCAFLPHTQINGLSKISKISTFYNKHGLLGVRLGSADDNLCPSNVKPASIPHQISTSPWDSETSLAFSFSLYSDIVTPDEDAIFLHHLCRALEVSMDNIDTLECNLSNYHKVAVKNTFSIYTIFPAVTTLQLNNSERDDVDIGFVLGSLSPQGRNYFPKLQALHIARKFSSTDIDYILDTVKKRVDDGRPLRVLTLSGEFTGQEARTEVEQRFEQLRALVPSIRFDVSRRGYSLTP
ncbi:hypothetical protein PENSPDRAFT_659553 [Peniophora sp. CONT]|nr:hypothetical protein PENSPDRAFT_659553 [Peniophora sp. CONT]